MHVAGKCRRRGCSKGHARAGRHVKARPHRSEVARHRGARACGRQAVPAGGWRGRLSLLPGPTPVSCQGMRITARYSRREAHTAACRAARAPAPAGGRSARPFGRALAAAAEVLQAVGLGGPQRCAPGCCGRGGWQARPQPQGWEAVQAGIAAGRPARAPMCALSLAEGGAGRGRAGKHAAVLKCENTRGRRRRRQAPSRTSEQARWGRAGTHIGEGASRRVHSRRTAAYQANVIGSGRVWPGPRRGRRCRRPSWGAGGLRS
jgi:hypothetical protein